MNKVAFFFVITAVVADIFQKNDSLAISLREDNFFYKTNDDLRKITNELFTSLNLNRDFMKTGKMKTLQLMHDTLRSIAENNYKTYYDIKNKSQNDCNDADKTTVNLLFNLSKSIEETLKENHMLLSSNATDTANIENENGIPKNVSLIITNEKYKIHLPVRLNFTINLPISDLIGSSHVSKKYIANETAVEKNVVSNTDAKASVSVAKENEFLIKKEMTTDISFLQINNISFTNLGFPVVTKSFPISDVTNSLILSKTSAEEPENKTPVQYSDVRKHSTLGDGNVIKKKEVIVTNYSFPKKDDGGNESFKLPSLTNNITIKESFTDYHKKITEHGKTVPFQFSDARRSMPLTDFTNTFKVENSTSGNSFLNKEFVHNLISHVVNGGLNVSLQMPVMKKIIPVRGLTGNSLTDNNNKNSKFEKKVLLTILDAREKLHTDSTETVKSDSNIGNKVEMNELLENITLPKTNDASNVSMKFRKTKIGFPLSESSSMVSNKKAEKVKSSNKVLVHYAEVRKTFPLSELTRSVIKLDNSQYSDVRKSLPIDEEIKVGKSEIIVKNFPLLEIRDTSNRFRQFPAVRHKVPISDLTGKATLSDNSAERSENEKKVPLQYSDVRKSLSVDDTMILDEFENKEISGDLRAFKIIGKQNVFPQIPGKTNSFPISDLTGGGLMSDYSEEKNRYDKEISVQYADVRKSLPVNDFSNTLLSANYTEGNETDYSTMINIGDKSNVSSHLSTPQSFSADDKPYCLLWQQNNITTGNGSLVGEDVKNFTSSETKSLSEPFQSFNNLTKNRNNSSVVSNNKIDGTIFAKKNILFNDFTSVEINRLKASIQGSNMRKVFQFNDTFLPENSTENLYDDEEIPLKPLVTTDDRWDDALPSIKTSQLLTNISRNWTQRTVTAEHRFLFKRFTENDVKIPPQKQYFRRNYINFETSSQNQTITATEHYTPSLIQSKHIGSRRTTSKKNVTRKINLKAWLPPNSSEIFLNNTRRIYKGKQVSVKKYPFMASIHIRGNFMCGGSIINRELILTAASCLQLAYNNRNYRDKASEISVRVGSEYTTDAGQVIKVEDVYFHPKYDCVNLRNNLAIARINQQLEFKKNKYKIRRIDFDRIEAKLPESGGVTILGWGDKEKYSKYNGPLSMARLEIYGLEPCKEVYTEQYVNDKNFCAGSVSLGSGACNRDVGGPGIIGSRLVGVVSFGPPTCGTPDGPTVFTKIGFYSKWIDQVIEKKTMPWQLPSSMLEASVNQTISGEHNYVTKKVLKLPENETKAVLLVRKLFKELVLSGHIQNFADLLYPDIEVEMKAEDEDKDKEIWTTKMNILNPPFQHFSNRSAFLQPAERSLSTTTEYSEDMITPTIKLSDLIVTRDIGPDIMAELSKVRDVIEPILFSQKNKSAKTTVQGNKKIASARPKTLEELMDDSDSIEYSDNYENNGNEVEFSDDGLSIEVATTIRAIKKSKPKFNTFSESRVQKSNEKLRNHKQKIVKKLKQKHRFRASTSVEDEFSREDERKVTIVEAVLRGGQMGSDQVEGKIISGVDRHVRERNLDNYVEKPPEEEEDKEPSRRNFLDYVNI